MQKAIYTERPAKASISTPLIETTKFATTGGRPSVKVIVNVPVQSEFTHPAAFSAGDALQTTVTTGQPTDTTADVRVSLPCD
jgi:hypothetical protein